MTRIVDLTHPFGLDANVPAALPGPTIERIRTFAKDGRNSSKITLAAHTGTHLDAPWHTIDTGLDIQGISMDRLIGPAVVWAFPMGDKKLAGIAAEDIGKIAYGILKAGNQYIGKRVGVYGEALTIEEMGKKLASAVGLPSVYYHAAGADEYRGYKFPGADEMGNMFQYYRDFDKEFFALRDLNTAKTLNPALQSFDAFLQKNKDKVKAATEPAPAPAST